MRNRRSGGIEGHTGQCARPFPTNKIINDSRSAEPSSGQGGRAGSTEQLPRPITLRPASVEISKGTTKARAVGGANLTTLGRQPNEHGRAREKKFGANVIDVWQP